MTLVTWSRMRVTAWPSSRRTVVAAVAIAAAVTGALTSSALSLWVAAVDHQSLKTTSTTWWCWPSP